MLSHFKGSFPLPLTCGLLKDRLFYENTICIELFAVFNEKVVSLRQNSVDKLSVSVILFQLSDFNGRKMVSERRLDSE